MSTNHLLLSLPEANAIYCNIHRERINKEIKEATSNDYKASLANNELPYYNPDIPHRYFSAFYEAAAARDPQYFLRFCLSLNKVFWKVMAACVGERMPTNEKQCRAIAIKCCGEEAVTTFLLQSEQARAEKIQRRREKEQQDIETNFQNRLHREKINGTSVLDFVNELFRDGYTVTKKKQGIAYAYRVEKTNSDGRISFYPTPRSNKRSQANLKYVWNQLIIPYLLRLQDQEAITPTPTPTPAPTDDTPPNILAFPAPPPHSLLGRFPNLAKFANQ